MFTAADSGVGAVPLSAGWASGGIVDDDRRCSYFESDSWYCAAAADMDAGEVAMLMVYSSCGMGMMLRKARLLRRRKRRLLWASAQLTKCTQDV